MADFSFDKQALQNTLAVLDTSNKVEDVLGYSSKHEAYKNTDNWFLQIMMEICCTFLEPDPDKRALLFRAFEKELVRKKILRSKVKLDNFADFRNSYAKQVMLHLVKLRSRIVSSPKHPKNISDLFNNDIKYSNTYEDNFKELKEIGKGGFGSVYKVRHKVDRLVYAVKKIIFNFECERDYSEVMSEVESISRLNNKNIVSYKNCWIQHPSASDEKKFAEENGSDSPDSKNTIYELVETEKCATESDIPTDTSSLHCDSIYSVVASADDLTGKSDDAVVDSSMDYKHHETSCKNESLENIMFIDSSGNDLTSMKSSLLLGDFSKNVSVSRCKTSHMTSWSSSSLSRTSLGFNDSHSESIKRASTAFFQFKPKNIVMLCIQMEYCDSDLKQWLERRSLGKSLPFQKDVKDIFREIVKGVSYFHSKSIIHRDLKPANIFYSKKDNSMKIGDFGLATLCHSSSRLHGNGKFQHTSKLGTKPYAAPEQIQRNNYDIKVDIYSLGIILLELLCLFRTWSEFYREIEKSVQGDLPEELKSQHPCYIKLFQNLTQKEAGHRMLAQDILNLPILQDDAEMDKTLLMQEIKDLKEALEMQRQEFEKILKEKDRIIEELRLEIKKLSTGVPNLKSKKGRKKH